MKNKKILIASALVVIGVLAAVFISIMTGGKEDNSWKAADGAWKITQYGTDADKQMMFYTIESSDGEFIIIDGGWADNAKEVRKIIKEHDNHVTAWILTHPHPDHIGAFNEIYANLDGIVIDRIYDNLVDYDYYASVANEWDEIDVYTRHLDLIFNGGQLVNFVNRLDTFTEAGLTFTCYNSYDDEVVSRTESVCNSGSLMLKISGNKESFLITADVEEPMAEFLIETYGDELMSDYVQMSHHGNWGLTKEFYDLVSAKVAFFDGPMSLYEKKDLYNGWEFMEYMKEKQATVYTFETVPNSIILR